MCGTVAWLEEKSKGDDEQFDLAAWFLSLKYRAGDMCDQLFFTGSVSKNTNNMNFPLKKFGISKNVSIFAEAI